MPMTRKDYPLLAEAFKGVVETLTRDDKQAYRALQGAARNVCRICKEQNSHFDTDRFMQAAGLNE